jgi:hypothetical protein
VVTEIDLESGFIRFGHAQTLVVNRIREVAVAIRDLPGPDPRSEQAAAAEAFRRLELMSTVSGRPPYAAAGFEVMEEVTDAAGGVRSRS